MKKLMNIVVIVLFVLLLLVLFPSLTNWIKVDEKEKVTFKENQVTKEDATLSIVTFGNRIEDKSTYFTQWESLSDSEKTRLKDDNELFMFSQTAFVSKLYEPLIQELVERNKTVLVYGYQLNLETVLKGKTDIIPLYEVGSSQKIYTYLYGTGYSTEHKKMIPITVMGNFSEEEMPSYIIKHLLKTYQKKAE